MADCDSTDGVHHVVEPIAIEMNVDIVGDGRVCMTEQLREDFYIHTLVIEIRRKGMSPYMKSIVRYNDYHGSCLLPSACRSYCFQGEQLPSYVVNCNGLHLPKGDVLKLNAGANGAERTVYFRKYEKSSGIY